MPAAAATRAFTDSAFHPNFRDAFPIMKNRLSRLAPRNVIPSKIADFLPRTAINEFARIMGTPGAEAALDSILGRFLVEKPELLKGEFLRRRYA